jgi:hypothetical protein
VSCMSIFASFSFQTRRFLSRANGFSVLLSTLVVPYCAQGQTDVNTEVKFGTIQLRLPSGLPTDWNASALGNSLSTKHQVYGQSQALAVDKPIRVFAGKQCISISNVRDSSGLPTCVDVKEGQNVVVDVAIFNIDYNSFFESYKYNLGTEVYSQFCVALDASGKCEFGSEQYKVLPHQSTWNRYFITLPGSKVAIHYRTKELKFDDKRLREWDQEFILPETASYSNLKLAIPDLRSKVTFQFEAPKFNLYSLKDYLGTSILNDQSNYIWFGLVRQNPSFESPYSLFDDGTKFQLQPRNGNTSVSLVFLDPFFEPDKSAAFGKYIFSIFHTSSHFTVVPPPPGHSVDYDIPVVNVAPVVGNPVTQAFTIYQKNKATGEYFSYFGYRIQTGSSLYLLPDNSYRVVVEAKDEQGNFIIVNDKYFDL